MYTPCLGEIVAIMGQQEFIHGLKKVTAQHRGCVATIGSFDGVHCGHQKVLAQLKQQSASLDLPSLVMVFEPQPHEYFSRETAPPRLSRLRQKVCLLFQQGIDRVLCLTFNEALRSLTAREYIDQVLIEGLGIRYLVIGDDFRFGCDRSGDFAMLCRAGESNGFQVSDTLTQIHEEERISSTRIRHLLDDDKLADAAQLLGRPFSVLGRVQYGKQLGRKLGFPTLNIGLGRYRAPLSGVFAVEVESDRTAIPWQGVANVGVRPTISGGGDPLLEVHLLDQKIDLYGSFVNVIFKKKIRSEIKFDGLDSLQKQVNADIQTAKNYFANLNHINRTM